MDWGGSGIPAVGQVVRRLTPTQQVAGYWRVTSVRIVRNRKPLEPGVAARYRVTADYLGEKRPAPVDWTLHAYLKRSPPAPRPQDRFSPLLDPETEVPR